MLRVSTYFEIGIETSLPDFDCLKRMCCGYSSTSSYAACSESTIFLLAKLPSFVWISRAHPKVVAILKLPSCPQKGLERCLIATPVCSVRGLSYYRKSQEKQRGMTVMNLVRKGVPLVSCKLSAVAVDKFISTVITITVRPLPAEAGTRKADGDTDSHV